MSSWKSCKCFKIECTEIRTDILCIKIHVSAKYKCIEVHVNAKSKCNKNRASAPCKWIENIKVCYTSAPKLMQMHYATTSKFM